MSLPCYGRDTASVVQAIIAQFGILFRVIFFKARRADCLVWLTESLLARGKRHL